MSFYFWDLYLDLYTIFNWVYLLISRYFYIRSIRSVGGKHLFPFCRTPLFLSDSVLCQAEILTILNYHLSIVDITDHQIPGILLSLPLLWWAKSSSILCQFLWISVKTQKLGFMLVQWIFFFDTAISPGSFLIFKF